MKSSFVEAQNNALQYVQVITRKWVIRAGGWVGGVDTLQCVTARGAFGLSAIFMAKSFDCLTYRQSTWPKNGYFLLLLLHLSISPADHPSPSHLFSSIPSPAQRPLALSHSYIIHTTSSSLSSSSSASASLSSSLSIRLVNVVRRRY